MTGYRYENPAGEYGLPGDPHSPNPGPGVRNMLNADGYTKFKSFIPDPPPEATRVYYMTMSFQNIWNHMYFAFFNTTVTSYTHYHRRCCWAHAFVELGVHERGPNNIKGPSRPQRIRT